MQASTSTPECTGRNGPPPKPEPGLCQDCGGTVEPHLLKGWAGEPQGHWLVPDLCDGCAATREDRQAQRKQEALARRRWSESGLPEAARAWDFAAALERAQALKSDPADFALWERAYHACRSWLAIRCGRDMLYIYGPEGTGKTVLGWCLARLALESPDGPDPLWLSLPGLFKLVEESYSAGSPARDLAAKAELAGLLIVDEVGGPGADRPRKRERDAFFGIINHRANWGRPTVVTTNLPPDDLSKVFKDPYDRTVARLIRGDGIYVAGKSFRLIEAEGRW